MQIAFLRHAQANPTESSDFARTLTNKGRDDINCLGKLLKQMGCKFSICLYSPLTRTEETATILSRHVIFEEGCLKDERLKSGSSFEDYAELIKDYKHFESILLVGHMPEIGAVPTELLGTALPVNLSPGSFLLLSTPFFQPGSSSLHMYLPVEYVHQFNIPDSPTD